MIQPNANPETAAVIGDAWPEHDEDAFRADAANQRQMANAANGGAAAVSIAGEQTVDAVIGATGSRLQDRLGEDASALTIAGDRHAEAASHLDAAVINIEEAKASMNAVDADYHAQATTLTARAAAEGWTAAETALARNDLLAQAQRSIADIRAGFDGAYEGVVAALTATSGASAPSMAPGTVDLPPARGATNAHQMGQATGSAAVDFTAGLLSGVTGQTGGAGDLGVGGGVYAPGYGGMGALGGMGTGYGVLAPGYGAMGGFGGGYGMGMGMGMGAQPSPLNQIGQAVGGIAQSVFGGGQAGLAGQLGVPGQTNLGGMLAGQSGAAGQAGGVAPSGLAALLQQGGLQGDLNGVASASAGLTTDLSSATSGGNVEQALSDAIDAVAADLEGGEESGEATDEVEADDDAADDDTRGDVGNEKPADTAVGENDDKASDDKPEDGSIPARPVAATESPLDPVTRLQTDVNNAIAGAATAAHNGVDGAADTARAAMSTQVGFVTTGDDGAIRADTIGLHGPQHIDAIRTETSAADLGSRDTGLPATPAASHAAPAAPYGAGAPMMGPAVGPASPAAPIAAAPGAGAAPVGRPAAPDLGRLHRVDDIASPTSHTASSVDAAIPAAGVAAPTFLSLLRAAVAGAHTRLALLRIQQFTGNAVTPSAVGVFEDDTTTTYVLATAHGVSYLPYEGSVPSDTRLLTELVDDRFYAQWCGHMNPVMKLTDFASRSEALGELNYVLTSLDGVHVPGVEVVTQSLSDVKSLVESELLAPSSRSRRDLILAHDTSLGSEVRDMAMRTHVLRGDQYLHVLGRASAALWSNLSDRAPYLEHWMRVLTADALRSADRGSAEDAWFAVDEYRRVEKMLAPVR